VGSVLGALVTFFLYGVGPLSLVMYLLGSPVRRRARQAAEAEADAALAAAPVDPALAAAPAYPAAPAPSPPDHAALELVSTPAGPKPVA